MLKATNWFDLSQEQRTAILSRPQSSCDVDKTVKNIITAVRERGDQALLEFTREFDERNLESLTVSAAAIQNAKVSSEAYNAITAAIDTITRFHETTMPQPIEVTTAPGITIQRIYRPIEKVGLYVPGGNNTPLISSLLMQAIPAKIAGCAQRVLCTPVNKEGTVDPHLLVAARLCDIEVIYQIGGAQAIAAMAYGTQSVIKVDKIFGPGNGFVTAAKSLVSTDAKGAAIDMPAGPSEVLIVADNYANPDFVAADLLAQAEHGIDSQVILLCDSEAFAVRVQQALTQQYKTLSRQKIIQQALKYGAILVCPSIKEQIAIINNYAPEHLIINRRDAADWVSDIQSAGTIFLGPWAAETMGDYVSGSNHVLPTNGFARSHSGLGTSDFLKSLSVQSVSERGLVSLGSSAVTLAMIEGLDAHANAITQRLSSLER